MGGLGRPLFLELCIYVYVSLPFVLLAKHVKFNFPCYTTDKPHMLLSGKSLLSKHMYHVIQGFSVIITLRINIEILK